MTQGKGSPLWKFEVDSYPNNQTTDLSKLLVTNKNKKMTKLPKLISNLKSLINKYWKWGHKSGATAALPGFNTDSD